MKIQTVTITAEKVGSVTMFTISRDVKPAFVAIATDSDLSFKNFSGNGHNCKGSFEHTHNSNASVDDFVKAVFQV